MSRTTGPGADPPAEADERRLRERPDSETVARRHELALLVAQKYYMHDWTMEAIARHLGTSRSTVSRLLSHARDAGLVEIKVLPPDSPSHPLQALVERAHGVSAHVVRVPSGASPAERIERTASHAARLLASVLESDMIVGIAWGTMVNAISQHLVPKTTSNMQFVQLNGTGFSRTPGVHHAASILASFGDAFHGFVQPYPVPIFFDDARTRQALLAERSVRSIRVIQENADAVVFSVGTVEQGVPSSPYLTGYHLDASDFQELSAAGAVGDIATTYLRPDGSHQGIALNDRSSGPDLDILRHVRHRVCAVSGDHKIPALRAALQGGYVSELVIDDPTARLLLAEG
ncbi:sugar-binding transcriptional regulator [Aeromicrobium sp. CTD01-1L150]|uniref:sugar-binding transcriptional regulator n=1 Tax=Aeromicrobium sp. CTD01-1L150 TaxID=3341830 RepID=UPI0035C0D7DA